MPHETDHITHSFNQYQQLSGILKDGNVPKAIKGHVLAEASLTGTYTLNPKLG